jgi:class 3 adenylate cyclase
LLGILLPLFVMSLAVRVPQFLWPSRVPSVGVSADEVGGYPTLVDPAPSLSSPEVGLEPGDRLVRVGTTDLRGVGAVGFFARATAEARYGRPAPRVVFERDGARGETSLPVEVQANAWYTVPASCAWVFAAVFLALRARASALARRTARAFLLMGLASLPAINAGVALNYAGLCILAGAGAFAYPLCLQVLASFARGGRPAAGWSRLGPWLFASQGVLYANLSAAFPFRLRLAETLVQLHLSLYVLTAVAVAARVYGGANALLRRQIRWLVLGVYVGLLPVLTVTVLVLIDRWLSGQSQRFEPFFWPSMGFAGVLIPISILIASARYNLFDVDRFLSATASYNIVVAALVGAGLVIVPWFGETSSRLLGLDPRLGQLALALALAGAVVPAHQRLRPRIDRIFFKERYALDQGIAELLRELSLCENARALTEHVGESLYRTLQPEACVVYAGAEGAFAPVFAEGRAVPPAFEAGSALVATLRRRSRPLALSAAGRTPDPAELGPFDRAALEALQAEVIVPVRRDDALLAFLCLGPKRSGDVYTGTDLSLLAAVAAAASAQLHRFDLEEVIASGRAMQDALRRYVPGAVAEQLAGGAEPVEGEREVAVLFVDIRGYTSLAEARRGEEIFSTVNRYAETVSEAVRAQGGAVVEFNGDGMMAVFGAPLELAHKERAAVAAGRAILEAVARLPVERGEGPLTVGVGIATGPAFVGSLRAVDRLIWTALGTTNNLAARLQALTRELDVPLVVDRATWEKLGTTAADFELHPAVSLRGLRHAEDVYALAGAHPAAARARRSTGLFLREGDVWRVAWAGREVQLRDQRGLAYLAELLRHPGKEIHSLDLVRTGGVAGVPLGSAAAAAAAREADGALSIARGLGGAGEALDAKARAAYRARLTELDADLAEAERHHDLGRMEALGEEREVLVAELAGAARGAGASVASDAERARVAVTKGLKSAQERIAAAHPELAAHLAATLRRGTFCCYQPDPGHPVEWEA